MKNKSKLVRTLLSKKPKDGAALMSFISLLALTALFFVDQGDFLGASFDQVFTHHRFWLAFTAPFVHADFEHLGSNAVFFAGLAFLLNGYFGLWAFPILSLFAGGLINLLVLPFYPHSTTVVGASGIVYFMAAFWLALYFAIERGLPKLTRFMNSVAFAMVLLIPETAQAHVSYLSHAVGFILGIVTGILFFTLQRDPIRSHEVWEEIQRDDDCPNSDCPFENTA